MANNVKITFHAWLDLNRPILLADYHLKFSQFEQYRWDLFVEQQYIAYARSGRRIVSEQGASITNGQRARMAQQQQVRAFMSPVLADQVAQTLAVLASPKLVPFKPDKTWFLERSEAGTCSVAEWMGF